MPGPVTKDRSPKDGADRQKDYRDRQRALGRAPRLLYLTDAEHAEVKALLRKLRASEP
jgi:hypothetical protein